MRRIPLSRRSHITGFQPLSAGSADHESALERDFVTLVRFADAGANITSQPVTIEFSEAGRARRYTPDFLVRWSDGHGDLIEVKYWADLAAHGKQWRAGFRAARTWAREHKATFRVASDRSIRTPRLINAKRLLPLRGAPLDPAVALQARAVFVSQQELTFGGLVDALIGDRAVVLGTLWRMIARGVLSIDLNVPIDLRSPIRLARSTAQS